MASWSPDRYDDVAVHRDDSAMDLQPTDENDEEEPPDLQKPRPRQSFTPLQSRRLPSAVAAPVCALCPSMDLVALGLRGASSSNAATGSSIQQTPSRSPRSGGGIHSTPSRSPTASTSPRSSSDHHSHHHHHHRAPSLPLGVATTVSIHRTVSWQKLVTLTQSDLTSPSLGSSANDARSTTPDGSPSGGSASSHAPPPRGATSLCWGPDGRSVAVGLADGGVLIYDVEAACGGSATGGGSGGMMGDGGGNGGVVHAISPMPCPCRVEGVDSAREEKDVGDGSKADGGGTKSGAAATGNQDATAKHQKGKKGAVRSPVFSPPVTRSVAAQRRRQQALARRRALSTQSPGRGGFVSPSSSTSKMDVGTRLRSSVPASDSESMDKGEGAKSPGGKERAKYYVGGWRKNAVVGLAWGHVGRRHGRWRWGVGELEREESWGHRSRYVDRAGHFLPPSAYNPSNAGFHENSPHEPTTALHLGEDGAMQPNANTHPTSLTPLSVLCVSTVCNGLHLYLHSRYRILSLPSPLPTPTTSANIVFTSDLSNILVHPVSPSSSAYEIRMSLYTIPNLAHSRYDLQAISASYCAITRHLRTLTRSTREAHAAWTNALKPLDVKFALLDKLLHDYGVLPQTCGEGGKDGESNGTGIRSELLRYILAGHSTGTSDVSSAMDQFFAGVQMNDQLLQRLERSVEGSMASLEIAIRRGVLAPAKALTYAAGEVHGLALAMSCGRTTGSSAAGMEDGLPPPPSSPLSRPLLDVETALRLQRCCDILVVTVEQCLCQVVEVRFRLRDLLAWVRGTASQVKARGTAVDSVQRENARKRRVPEGVVRRVAEFLSSSVLRGAEKDGQNDANSAKKSLTEFVIGVPLSDYFLKDYAFVLRKSIHQAMAPLASRELQENIPTSGHKQVAGMDCSIKVPTIKAAASTASHIVAALFEEPRSALAQSVGRTEFSFSMSSRGSDILPQNLLSIHKRIGMDGEEGGCTDSDPDVTCFWPRVVPHGGEHISFQNRHWLLIAVSRGAHMNGHDVIQIAAFPTKSDGIFVAGGCDLGAPSSQHKPHGGGGFYLTSFVALPRNCRLKETGFYGDDGNSSLSAAADRGTGNEGRQAMGLLVDRELNDTDGSWGDSATPTDAACPVAKERCSEELWVFRYDHLVFRPVAIAWNPQELIVLHGMEENERCCEWLKPEDCDDDELTTSEQGSNIDGLQAKRRQLRVHDRERNGSSTKIESGSLDEASSRMLLSGSRGIGGVFTNNVGTALDLFDLEEDVDSDDDDNTGEE